MPMRRRASRRLRARQAGDLDIAQEDWPEVGSTRRLMQRISVDLPAPDGPIRPTTWPAGTSNDDAPQRLVAGPVSLGEIDDAQHFGVPYLHA